MPKIDGTIVFLEMPSADEKASLPVVRDGKLRASWGVVVVATV